MSKIETTINKHKMIYNTLNKFRDSLDIDVGLTVPFSESEGGSDKLWVKISGIVTYL